MLLYSSCISVFLLASSSSFWSSPLSQHAHLDFLFFSRICISVLLFFYALATATHASTCIHYSQQQWHGPFSVLHFYSLSAPCAFCMRCATAYRSYVHHHSHFSWGPLASLVVTLFDSLPFVSRLYDESTLHWQWPRDSSSSLLITLKTLRIL